DRYARKFCAVGEAVRDALRVAEVEIAEIVIANDPARVPIVSQRKEPPEGTRPRLRSETNEPDGLRKRGLIPSLCSNRDLGPTRGSQRSRNGNDGLSGAGLVLCEKGRQDQNSHRGSLVSCCTGHRVSAFSNVN